MEALIGFAIGYYVGTREGREGLEKAIAAFDAISKSTEFKNLLGQGLSMGGALLSKGLEQTGGMGFAQGVVGVVAELPARSCRVVCGLRKGTVSTGSTTFGGTRGERMCLGIPGEVIELLDRQDLAKVNVSGVRRAINIGLLENENVQPGDWILIHVGFALSKIDEDEAAAALAFLEGVGQAYTDELDALAESSIE